MKGAGCGRKQGTTVDWGRQYFRSLVGGGERSRRGKPCFDFSKLFSDLHIYHVNYQKLRV